MSFPVATMNYRGNGSGNNPSQTDRPQVYQIDFTAVASGKRIASTKRRVRWRFGFANPQALASGETGTACRGEEHDVTIVWSITSGKRLVLADGQEVHYSSSRNNLFEFSWTMRGNHVLKIAAHASPPISAEPGFRQYDFFVDGQSFFTFPKVYRLGLSPNDPRGVASPRGSSSAMVRSSQQHGYGGHASVRSTGSANIASLEAPHNPDEEEAYLQAAIKNSLTAGNAPPPPSHAAPAPPPATEDLLFMDAPAPSAASVTSYGTPYVQQPPPPQQQAYGALPPSTTGPPPGAGAMVPAPSSNPWGYPGGAPPGAPVPGQHPPNPYGAPPAAPAAGMYGAPQPAAVAADPFGAPQQPPAPYPGAPGAPPQQAYPGAPGAPPQQAAPYDGGFPPQQQQQPQQAMYGQPPAVPGQVSQFQTPTAAAAQQQPAPFGSPAPTSVPANPQNFTPASSIGFASPLASSQGGGAPQQQQQPPPPAPHPVAQVTTVSSDISVGQHAGSFDTPAVAGAPAVAANGSTAEPPLMTMNTLHGDDSLLTSMNGTNGDAGAATAATGSMADQAYAKLVNMDAFDLVGKSATEADRVNPFDMGSGSIGGTKSLSAMKKTATEPKKEVMKTYGASAMVVSNTQQQGNYGGYGGVAPAAGAQYGMGAPQPPPGQAAYGGQPAYGQPQQPMSMQPQQPGGFGQPPMQQQQEGFGQPMGGAPMGQQQPGFGQAPPMGQPGFGQQPQYGQPQQQPPMQQQQQQPFGQQPFGM